MFLESGARPVCEADSRLSRQCEIVNITQLYRPPLPVTGIASHVYVDDARTSLETPIALHSLLRG
jgi:hypothetical protein